MKRIIIAQESDLHAGSKLGLMNPEIELVDLQMQGDEIKPIKYTPQATECQKELWKLRKGNIQKLIALANGDPIYYIQDGDPTHGNKHPGEWVTTRMSDQITIAVNNAMDIMRIKGIQSADFAVGTAAHNFGQGSSDISMVEQLKLLFPEIKIGICYHGLVHYGEFTVDFAHHGPYVGSREWLKGNVARYYLQSLMMHQIKHNRKPPDLVIRGHYHAPLVETVRMGGYTSHIIVSPSMCMMDDFAHQAAKSPDDVTCGMFAYEVIDGKLLEVYQYTETYDTRTEIFR